MITKVKANKSFRGTTKYVLEKEKAKIIGGNMYGKSTNKLVEQFTLSAHLNPQLKDPCYHLMLSVPKNDRTLNDDELANLSQRHLASVIVLSRLKGDESQVKKPDKRIADTKLNQLVDDFISSELPAYDFFIARHSDKEHDHTHIVASRVNNLDGKSIRTWNNYAHSEHSARLLEREFQLTPVQSSWESKQKAMTRNQLERVERDGLPGEEIMRRAIEQVVVNKPTMPQLIERLWREHQVKAIVSYYGHGGVRGIKFGIDVGSVNEDGSPRLLWKQGGNLNKYKCSFTKLQTELGINYDPKRDDGEIKRLNNFLESLANNQVNQQLITKILPVQTQTIAETQPQLTPSQSDTEHQANSQLINSISDFIEKSAVESTLIEKLPQLTKRLSGYQQQLANNKTTLDDLGTAIADKKQQLFSQREDDLGSAIADVEQELLSQRAVDAVALNKAQTLAADKPKLKDNLSAELYQYYSADLQNLLVTDRDKEIAIRALLDNKPPQDVEEIIQASPAAWTQDEARELVLIASNQLATQKSEPEQSLDQKQRQEDEFLAKAVPIAVKLINWQLRESGENSLRFKRATLEKQGRELVFNHDERGEIFRVAVNRNQSGKLEYSPINIGEIEREDHQFWQEAERVLQQRREEAERQERRQNKGISL